jgi:hypothetical protein
MKKAEVEEAIKIIDSLFSQQHTCTMDNKDILLELVQFLNDKNPNVHFSDP